MRVSITIRPGTAESEAVRSLPRPSRQRATRFPFRVIISALGGKGLVACFLNTLPMRFALGSSRLEFQSKVRRQSVGHVEPEAALASHEARQAGPLHFRLPRDPQQWEAGIADGLPDHFRHALHCANCHTTSMHSQGPKFGI